MAPNSQKRYGYVHRAFIGLAREAYHFGKLGSASFLRFFGAAGLTRHAARHGLMVIVVLRGGLSPGAEIITTLVHTLWAISGWRWGCLLLEAHLSRSIGCVYIPVLCERR